MTFSHSGNCPTLPIWCFGVLWWWTPEKRFDWLTGFGDVKLLIGRFPLGRLRWPSNSCWPGAMTAIGWHWPREWQSGGFWPEMGSKVKGSNKGQTTKKKIKPNQISGKKGTFKANYNRLKMNCKIINLWSTNISWILQENEIIAWNWVSTVKIKINRQTDVQREKWYCELKLDKCLMHT